MYGKGRYKSLEKFAIMPLTSQQLAAQPRNDQQQWQRPSPLPRRPSSQQQREGNVPFINVQSPAEGRDQSNYSDLDGSSRSQPTVIYAPVESAPRTMSGQEYPRDPNEMVDYQPYLSYIRRPQEVAPVYPPNGDRLHPLEMAMGPQGHKLKRGNGSVVSSRRSHDKFAEVMSDASSTFQFAANLRNFVDEKVPPFVWILFCILQVLFGFISVFIGTLNYTSCLAEPKVPVYVVLSGVILIVNGLVRICGHIPTQRPGVTGDNGHRRRDRGYGFCRLALEGSVLFVMLAVVVLGCIWVYGARFVQFDRYSIYASRYDYNYCDHFLYWFAWWSVGGHLVMFGLIILALIVILLYGAALD